MHGNNRPRTLLQDSRACLLLYLTVNPSLSRRTGTERIARTGFWLSLFRFQGATGHTPIKPELVPGVPKDCSRRTAAAGKSPSGAGRRGAYPAGVSPYQVRTRGSTRSGTKLPARGTTPARPLESDRTGAHGRSGGYPGAPDQGFRRHRHPPSPTRPAYPVVACGEPTPALRTPPGVRGQQAFHSRSAPPEPP